jgi:serine/threonine protein kinase
MTLDAGVLPHQRRQKGTYRLADFYFQRTLGTGSFGRVHLGQSPAFPQLPLLPSTVRSKHNLRFYAIKVLHKEKIVKSKQIDHTNNEQQMLLAVQHPFIINLWGSFQDATNLYMVMDFVPGGELFTLLRRSNVCLFFLLAPWLRPLTLFLEIPRSRCKILRSRGSPGAPSPSQPKHCLS